jgi:two-component system, cell cycle sensor histidine kinase and response regulator CckA
MNSSPNGSPQTILVVDDNEHVRALNVAILESKNYHVLSANSAPSAIKLAHETKGPIDLLLSEIEFPEISGPDMGELLKKTRPAMHVMLMSAGATGNLLVLNYGWAYIQKPFIGGRLTKMIYDVLNSKDRSQPGGQGFDSRNDVAHAVTGEKVDTVSGEEK